MPLLFSYGTLQQEDVQQSTFGRLLRGERDELPGFEPSVVAIQDSRLAAESGRTHHANVTFTGGLDTRVPGTLFEITEPELAAADDYERRAAYVRVAVTLASGRPAWVYVDARSASAIRGEVGGAMHIAGIETRQAHAGDVHEIAVAHVESKDLDGVTARRPGFEGATPIVPVRQLQVSIDFYVTMLGFEVRFVGPGKFAAVSRDRCDLFLCEGDQGHPGTWVWIGVEDVEALLEECRASGLEPRHPPTNYPWAYEMQLEDPDGNVLRIGSERRADRPDGASWRDMRGVRWVRSPAGEWSRADG
jgi:predicted enzyme related to lactoylglutathione lyase